MIGSKARIGGQQMRETLHHQSGTDNQHKGECALCDHQSGTSMVSTRAERGTAAGLLQGLIHIEAETLEHREQPEENPGQERNEKSKNKNRGVNMNGWQRYVIGGIRNGNARGNKPR